MNLNDYPFDVQSVAIDYAEHQNKRLIAHLNLVRLYWDEIHAIKECIANDDIEGAKANLSDIEPEDQEKLWRAPKYGSVWTTKEREALKG